MNVKDGVVPIELGICEEDEDGLVGSMGVLLGGGCSGIVPGVVSDRGYGC